MTLSRCRSFQQVKPAKIAIISSMPPLSIISEPTPIPTANTSPMFTAIFVAFWYPSRHQRISWSRRPPSMGYIGRNTLNTKR